MSERSGELRDQCANYALPSLPTYPSLPEEQNYSPSTPSERSSTREPRSEVDGWDDEPLRDRLYEFDTPEGPRLGWYRPYIWAEAFHSNRAWPVDDVPSWRLLVPQPLNSEPPQGPVEVRATAEIRADLACCEQLAIVPWPAAARRLLADVPSLLAEVEAAHRFERSVAVEREALLAEVAELRELTDAARLLGPARRVLDMAAEGEATREECAAMAQRIVDLIGHPVTDEPPHAIVERDSLRGVVQAVDAEIADEIRACELAGDRAGTDLMSRPIVIGHLRRIREKVAALAAAADAPQPESDPADYGPAAGDDGPDPEDTLCRVCDRPAIEHTRGRFSIYGVCPVAGREATR